MAIYAKRAARVGSGDLRALRDVEGLDWSVTSGFVVADTQVAVTMMQRSLAPVIEAARSLQTVPWFSETPLWEVQERRKRGDLPPTRLGHSSRSEVGQPRGVVPWEESGPSPARAYFPPVVVEFKKPRLALLWATVELNLPESSVLSGGQLLTYLLDVVPVPVFGSPPQTLQSVGNAISNMAPGAAILLPSAPDVPSFTHVIVAGVATTLWITYGRPTLKVTGAAYQRWLQRKLRVTAADMRRYGTSTDTPPPSPPSTA